MPEVQVLPKKGARCPHHAPSESACLGSASNADTATLVGLMHRSETLRFRQGFGVLLTRLCCALQKDPCDATFGKAKKVTAVMFADIGDRHERHTLLLNQGCDTGSGANGMTYTHGGS